MKHYTIYQRQGSPFYWANINYNGNKIQFSTKTTNKIEAVKIVKSKIKLLKQGKDVHTPIPKRTLDKVIDEYLQSFLDKYNVCTHLKPVKEYLGHLTYTELTDKHIINYKDHRKEIGRADGTIRLELDYFKAALRNRHDDNEHIKKLFKKVFSKRGVHALKPKEKQNVFSHKEYLTILKVLPDYLEIMTRIAYLYPVRAEELRNMKPSDIDLEKRTMRIYNTKNKTFRSLDITEGLYEHIKVYHEAHKHQKYLFELPYRKDRVINSSTFVIYWNKYLKVAGLNKDLTFHRLRATAATNLERANFSMSEIMAAGGWETEDILMRYLGRGGRVDKVSMKRKLEQFEHGLRRN